MKILLAGDSTVATYNEPQKPMAGWGEGLKKYLQEQHPSIGVRNYSKAGASTKTFQEEGIWAQLLEEVEKDDLVVIQFGHNDQKPTSGITQSDYVRNLKSMIQAVRNQKGEPILCTPIERRNVVNGKFEKTLATERRLMKRLANEEQVYLIDLNDYSYHYYTYNYSNPENTKELFMWTGKGESPNYLAGTKDDTHLSQKGSDVFGGYIGTRLRPYLQEAKIFNKYYYGACMYPEVWSEEIVKADIQHMKRIGMNFARIGEFIWSTLEPEENVFDLSFLEKVIGWYKEEGIDVMLCIPTPTPPVWLTDGHPERCVHNMDGTVMVHGSRQHACTNNAYFRDRSYRMTKQVAALANRFSNIIGIQLDNEFKCHVDLCFCDTCSSMWRKWLQEEYGHIGYLNKEWGLAIWSEEYLEFAQVPTPTRTPFLHHSSLMNAFRRFTAETLNEFAAGLCHVIRMETSIPITHNTALGFNLLNEDLFQELDFVGFDTYAGAQNHPGYTMNLDLWRNLKKRVNEFMLLETSTSHAGHIENYISPHPANYLVAEVFAGFAGGLTTFSYWHFRGHRFGVEQPHSTVVTPWGGPGNGYQDVVKSGEVIEQMRPYLSASSHGKASIGFLYTDHDKRHYNVETGGLYNHRGLTTDYYETLVRKGLSTEIIQESADFSSYKLLIIPFVRHVSSKLLAKCQEFVLQGGKIIFGPMTGDRTHELALNEKNGLGALGTWLELDDMVQFSMHDQVYHASNGVEAEPLDRLVTVFAPSDNWEPKIITEDQRITTTKRVFENGGSVVYVGSLFKDLRNSKVWDKFVDAEIRPHDEDQQDIEMRTDIIKYRRETSDSKQYYLVNMTNQLQKYQLNKTATELLAGQKESAGSYTLEAYQYKILEIQK